MMTQFAIAIQLAANVAETTGGFCWVFLILAILAAFGFSAALLLPGRRAASQ